MAQQKLAELNTKIKDFATAAGKAVKGIRETMLTAESTLDATKLSGTASIDTTGNAGTASKLDASRRITIDGDSSGYASFTGDADTTISVTISTISNTDIATILAQ